MAGARVIKKVTETIQRHGLISGGEYVLVGLSGGPDSLCLFDCLLQLQEKLDIRLFAAHINHGLRPGAADEDQAFVEDYCKRAGVKCFVFEGDCNALAKENDQSSEEAGRDLRYASYDAAATSIEQEAVARVEKPVVKIALAHNANDQAETLLFRMIRGTGPDGLAGMEYSRKSKGGFDIIRPILDCSREEVEAYIKKRRLHPCIDATNDQPIYSRNKIRLEIMPKLTEMNPNIVEALSRLAENAQEDKEYFWKTVVSTFAEALLYKSDTEIAMEQQVLERALPAVRHRVITHAFAQIGLTADIGRTHLEAADTLLSADKTGSEIHFPQGYIFALSYGKVLIRNAKLQAEELPEFGSEEGFIQGTYSISQMNDTRTGWDFEPPKPAVIFTITGPMKSINIRLVGLPEEPAVELRTRRDGDFIMLSSGGNLITKKLQDFFTDAKVPVHLRDQIPLLCVGREVLLVLGDDMTGLGTGLARSRYSGNYR